MKDEDEQEQCGATCFFYAYERTYAVELGSVRAGLRRGKLLGLRGSAKTISKNPELAPMSLRQQDF